MKARVKQIIKIKPCPFCGSDKIDVSSGIMAGITMFHCRKCGATVSFMGNETEPNAHKKWNERA